MFEKKDIRQFYTYHPIMTDDYFRGKPLEIGLGTQLLMGDTLVEDVYKVKQVQEQPEMVSQKPFLEAEYPWEDTMYSGLLPLGMIYDEDEDIYKLWYLLLGYFEDGKYSSFKDLKKGSVPGMMCYAESKDAENWTKPLTFDHSFGSVKENNVVFTGGENAFEGGRVFLNPRRDDPEKKYLIIYLCGGEPCIAASPDGRRWADIPGINPLFPVGFDTNLNVIYDDERDVYQLFIRPTVFAKHESSPNDLNDPNYVFRRRICLTESSDLIHWSPIRIVNHAPEGAHEDQCDHQSTFTIGATVIARVNRFYAHNTFDWGYQMHHQYWSYGPSPYKMRYLDEDKHIPYARHNGREIAPPQFYGYPFYKDNKTYFIVQQNAYNTKFEKSMYALNYLYFGENRFVSRCADAYGGWLLTREFIMRGNAVEINCGFAKGGEITAEILYGENGCVREGEYIHGFTREESDPIRENGYHTKLTWNGSPDLSRFKDQAIYIRFHLINAKLFSFTVVE